MDTTDERRERHGWRWEPGMLLEDGREDSLRVIAVGRTSDYNEETLRSGGAMVEPGSPEDGEVLFVCAAYRFTRKGAGWGGSITTRKAADSIPDWRDRATAGCLLAQFRERFGEFAEVREYDRDRWDFYVIQAGAPAAFYGASRLEVMLKALAWPGPQREEPPAPPAVPIVSETDFMALLDLAADKMVRSSTSHVAQLPLPAPKPHDTTAEDLLLAAATFTSGIT